MSSTARDRRRAIGFVVASTLIFVGVIGVLRGVRIARHDRVYYVSVPDSVSGLRAASTVEYKGVPIGVVRNIAFRNGSVELVEVELAVRQGVPIKTDTRARLQPQGITGLNILELVAGTENAPDLPEFGSIPIEPSVIVELEETLHDVARLAKRLNAVTAAVESEAVAAVADLHSAIVAGRDAARSLEATTAAIGTEVRESGAAFRQTAGDLHGILADPAWRSLGPEVAAALADVRHAVATLDRAALDASKIANENRDDVREAIENLRRASGDIRVAARKVRESPASVLVEHPATEKPIPDAMRSRDGKARP